MQTGTRPSRIIPSIPETSFISFIFSYRFDAARQNRFTASTLLQQQRE